MLNYTRGVAETIIKIGIYLICGYSPVVYYSTMNIIMHMGIERLFLNFKGFLTITVTAEKKRKPCYYSDDYRYIYNYINISGGLDSLLVIQDCFVTLLLAADI